MILLLDIGYSIFVVVVGGRATPGIAERTKQRGDDHATLEAKLGRIEYKTRNVLTRLAAVIMRCEL